MGKTCKKCGATKDFSEFPKFIQMADGYRNECKECTRKYISEYSKKNRLKRRDQLRIRYLTDENFREAVRASTSLSASKFPDRKEAHWRLNHAIERGDVIKDEFCFFCGAKEKLDAHHWSYSSPLNVTWLCRPCHKRTHAEAARYERQ